MLTSQHFSQSLILTGFRQYDFFMVDEILVDYDPHDMSGKPNNIRLFCAKENQANYFNQVKNAFWINLWIF
ncbi:hypothetical protein H6G00_29525 [Leptolyngbya sp. FACHB-541]|uniref:hypothetical protein n=1 Tax=Leptolyngbya sp. FACHB-541 TaxID=2692810 RepID=UPI001682CD6C|nr:hypothetical protein [Leptolyngbya sp. FACHB-541]MBD1866620.1 hypothetical protein [Cyanobacteria bacterium FACHB-471]MBD2000700.1 hypothetical protein [Leptolyngbya sp. FACHB-541]